MRLNKKKLAALAMSAVMAASTMSFPAFAEEIPAGEEMVFADEELVVDEAEVLDLDVEEEVQAPEEVQAETDAPGDELVVSDVVFTFDPEKPADGAKVTYNYGKEEVTQTDVKIPSEPKAATCLKNAQYILEAVLKDGKTYQSDPFEVPDTALGHVELKNYVKDENTEIDFIISPTCERDGKGNVTYVCSRCLGKETGTDKNNQAEKEIRTETILAQGHKFADDKVVSYKGNADKNTKLDENDKPQLINPTKDGYYDVVTKGTCTVCKQGLEVTTEVLLPAERVASGIVVKDDDAKLVNIVDSFVGTTFESYEEAKAYESSIELLDCSKEASYVVEWSNSEGDAVYRQEIKVAPHHYNPENNPATTIQFKDKEDAKWCEVLPKDGKKYVVNHSCYKTITYYEVTHCKAAGCKEKACDRFDENGNKCAIGKKVSEKAVTLEPAGPHSLLSAELKQVETWVKEGKAVDYKDITDLVGEANPNKKYYVVGDTTATCTEAGVTTVKFVCTICKKEVETFQVPTKALGHEWAKVATRKDITEATCTKGGTYEVAIFCTRKGCDACKEDTKRTYTTARLPHTNEVKNGDVYTTVNKDASLRIDGNKVVDNEEDPLEVGKEYKRDKLGTSVTGLGVGYIKAIPYTYCTACGKNVVPFNVDNMKIKVTALQKEDKYGVGGYVVVDAYFQNVNDGDKVVEIKDQKFPYYSSWAAYMGRVEKDPKDGLIKDADGIYRLYKDDEVQTNFTGLVDYFDGTFYVVNGVLASDVSGLKKIDDSYYYLSHGQVQKRYSGLVKFEGAWFYVTNGKLDTGINGLVDYQGGKFLFSQGKRRDDVSGLWKYSVDEKWYYLSHGQVQNKFTGVAFYNGAAFYVVNGVLAEDMNDVITYNGKQFKVTNGRLSSRPIK